jgi:hypothetical protein
LLFLINYFPHTLQHLSLVREVDAYIYCFLSGNTNIGPNQRACSSAFGIPKLSEFNPVYGNYYFSPFPQPLGLWERRAAWCKPTVPSNQKIQCSSTDTLVSYQIIKQISRLAFLLYFLLFRPPSLPRGLLDRPVRRGGRKNK